MTKNRFEIGSNLGSVLILATVILGLLGTFDYLTNTSRSDDPLIACMQECPDIPVGNKMQCLDMCNVKALARQMIGDNNYDCELEPIDWAEIVRQANER